MMKMSNRKGRVSNFHGTGGLKGGDELFIGMNWLIFFTTLGRILSTVMS